MPIASKLVNGRIPAHTRCPYRDECPMVAVCHHQSEQHPVAFSCATARLIEIVKRDEVVIPNVHAPEKE